MNGRTLSAWCAWDTLFLPELIGHAAEIESVGPVRSGTVRLTVTPERVEQVEPAGAQMSLLAPDAGEVQKNIVTSFCHFVHIFPTQSDGRKLAHKAHGNVPAVHPRGAHPGAPEEQGAVRRRVAVA